MKRVVLFIIWIFLVFIGQSIPSSEAVVDRIVAVVNQEVITLSEVEKLIRPQEKESKVGDRLEKRSKVDEVRRQILERLIEEKLLDQEVKKAGTKATSKEIETALEDIKHRNGTTQEELEKALAREGMTLEGLKKQIEKRIQRMKLINIAVKVEPNLGEKDLREFYQKNIDRYKGSESYRPSHILFRVLPEASQEEIGEIRKRCQKVLEKIKRGDDFGEMALLYSEDVSAKDRGDLGYFKKGELLPVFEKEALRLQVGEVSGIIRTEFGFHIITLLDRKGGGPLSFEEVKEKAQAEYYELEMEKALKQFITSLRAKSVIEIKL